MLHKTFIISVCILIGCQITGAQVVDAPHYSNIVLGDKTEIKTHVFSIQNPTDAPLVIADWQSTCSCTMAKIDSPVIPAKTTMQLPVTITLPETVHERSATVLLKFASSNLVKLTMHLRRSQPFELVPQPLKMERVSGRPGGKDFILIADDAKALTRLFLTSAEVGSGVSLTLKSPRLVGDQKWLLPFTLGVDASYAKPQIAFQVRDKETKTLLWTQIINVESHPATSASSDHLLLEDKAAQVRVPLAGELENCPPVKLSYADKPVPFQLVRTDKSSGFLTFDVPRLSADDSSKPSFTMSLHFQDHHVQCLHLLDIGRYGAGSVK